MVANLVVESEGGARTRSRRHNQSGSRPDGLMRCSRVREGVLYADVEYTEQKFDGCDRA